MVRLRLLASSDGIPNQRKVPRVKATNIEPNPDLVNLVQIFAVIAKRLIHHVNAHHLVKLVINVTKKATTLNVVIQTPLQTLDTPNLDSIGGHTSPSMRWKYMTLIVRHMCMTQLSLNAELDLSINLQEITSCLMKLGIVKINRES